MPIYEYICEICGHEWEHEASIKEKPVKVCPQCGKVGAKRQIGLTSFHLKGSGWAKDSYGNGK